MYRWRKVHGDVLAVQCGRCSNTVMYQHVSVMRIFSWAFIPLFPLPRAHFLVCPICSELGRVKRPYLPAVQKMFAATAAFQAGTLAEAQYQASIDEFEREIEAVAAATGKPRPIRSQGGAPAAAAAGWHPDPARRFQQRYWDGSAWTDHVATNRQSALHPLPG